ncbi:TIGR04282 family arsenosugar biosynthesis glycosyltransferase [Aureispira anguillae]|uniref:TIGR04282 family arsenosugar biosynthesis glycosyltransferase n=1 Tax=Aureispira anguillae TaxID=2864201 RepID=A0A915YGF2_9BACT|nr:TIGR04282 family arsenosugar biosynthesis glycosyltransferase [Aureispira anguillae]BDS12695.1 TIGR04282 family arsenosugar biosynthesis glycosyltransferase [Aureispira anguillae]
MINKKKSLMVFAKNPVLGTAKTRLAASVGDQKALEIYKFLLEYTAQITSKVNCERRVFYSTHTDLDDEFSNDLFSKTVQIQGDLGQKMYAAFEQMFKEGYQQVIIIGSDCYELSTEIISQAFEALDQHNFVIGPANDGGYYLLGMRQLESVIFNHKKWSQERLYHDTLIDLEALGYSYAELPMLSDVDYLEDLPEDVRMKFEI